MEETTLTNNKQKTIEILQEIKFNQNEVQLQDIILKLTRKHKRNIEKLNKYLIEKPENVFNYFGGVDEGRLRGQNELIETLFDDIFEDPKIVDNILDI
jgi:predicted CopG family antitoxin